MNYNIEIILNIVLVIFLLFWLSSIFIHIYLLRNNGYEIIFHNMTESMYMLMDLGAILFGWITFPSFWWAFMEYKKEENKYDDWRR